jgi:uncharacterized BrkB/YihY/UPF0761 family membrane protein
MLDYMNAVPKGFWGLCLIALMIWAALNLFWFFTDKEKRPWEKIWKVIHRSLGVSCLLGICLLFFIILIPLAFISVFGTLTGLAAVILMTRA